MNILKLRQSLKEKGIIATLRLACNKYMKIQSFVLGEKDITRVEDIQLPSQLKIEKGRIEELNTIRYTKQGLPREFYMDKIYGYKSFYLGYYDGEIGAIIWAAKKGDYSRFFDIQSSTTVNFTYIATLPQFKGLGIMPKMMKKVEYLLSQEGFKRIVEEVSSGNVNQFKVMQKAGHKEFKRVKSYFSFSRKTIV